MKFVVVFFLSGLSALLANADASLNFNQTDFDSYELSDSNLQELNFKFEIENPEGVARILADQSSNLVEQKYLVRGEEQISAQFANNLYDFSCGLQSSYLTTHTPVLRNKIINGQMKFAPAHPQFGISHSGNYVLERFTFPLDPNGYLSLVCFRHYIKGNKTTVLDLKTALSGYLKVTLAP
jgi:hypothetical protein